MSANTEFPTPGEGLAIHARLVARDPAAPNDFATVYLDPLARHLAELNRGIDPHHLAEAAEEAVLGVIKNPVSFNPEVGLDLEAYLRMAANGDLKNILKRNAKHYRQRVTLETVELSQDRGNSLGRDDPSLSLQIEEAVRAVAAAVDPVVRDGLTEAENRVLDLMLHRERKTRVFAEAYGIADRPPDEQERTIKRVKDKLKKRLERTGWSDESGT